MERADHHANNINEIALAVAGAIVWRKDGEPIKVMSREGNITNVLWVKIGGKRYAFSYNHQTGAIDIREGSTQGRVINAFTNATPLADLRRIFENL